MALPRRDRFLIAACILAVIGLAWAYLFYLDRQMSSSTAYDAAMEAMGMSMATAWTRTDVFFTFLMWVVMMIGMMAGAAAPVLLLFAAMRAGRAQGGGAIEILAFAIGYLAVWVGFSAVAALAQWGLHEAALLSPAMAASSPYVAGAILLVAGVYQLTPSKGACLTHCRSPLGFLMSSWQDGVRGAFGMGLRHGAFCLGCCWALMCVLFAVGVMNLVWVAALAVFVLVEKVGPFGVAASRAAGVGLIIAGLFYVSGFR